MTKIILFVDALEPTETHGTRFKETERGLVESRAPKVTPKVTSEVYTGVDPTTNGMGAQHSINGERTPRPRYPTIHEKLNEVGYDVVSLYLPYCHPLQLDGGVYVSDTMDGPQPGPSPASNFALHPPVVGSLMEPEDDGEHAYNSRLEEVFLRSSNLIATINAVEPDVAFVAVRSPDQYTHFQQQEDYRVGILEAIADEIGRWEVNHDVLWWSDHGSEPKTDVFRVNKWLAEKGYLDIEVDVEFHERFVDETGQDPSVENNIGLHAPGVEVGDDTVALSADPYDSSIDVVDDDFDPTPLLDDLRATGYYDYVERVEDEWGDGRFRDECPDIVAHRADGVLVTGNVHPEPIGMGFHRDGVHSAFGAWGTTDESFERSGDVRPRTLHDVIWEFVTGQSQIEAEAKARIDELKERMEATIGGGGE